MYSSKCNYIFKMFGIPIYGLTSKRSFKVHLLVDAKLAVINLAILTYMSSSPVFIGVSIAQSLVFCVVFCRSLFVFSGVSIAQSFVFCVVFCRSLFVFSGVSIAQSFVFCVVFCRSLFFSLSLLFWPAIVLFGHLLFTASDYLLVY